jgi:hypothetical protein
MTKHLTNPENTDPLLASSFSWRSQHNQTWPMLSINLLDYQLHPKTFMLMLSGELADICLAQGKWLSLISHLSIPSTAGLMLILLAIGNHQLPCRMLTLPASCSGYLIPNTACPLLQATKMQT